MASKFDKFAMTVLAAGCIPRLGSRSLCSSGTDRGLPPAGAVGKLGYAWLGSGFDVACPASSAAFAMQCRVLMTWVDRLRNLKTVGIPRWSPHLQLIQRRLRWQLTLMPCCTVETRPSEPNMDAGKLRCSPTHARDTMSDAETACDGRSWSKMGTSSYLPLHLQWRVRC